MPGYRRITDAVHAHDVPILAQIDHNGGQASSLYSRLPAWAPSAVPDPLFREVPKAVEQHEIRAIVAGYGRVAEHCAAGGFDGVELQCSHSSIVREAIGPGRALGVRLCGDELIEGGTTVDEAVAVARMVESRRRAAQLRTSGCSR